MRFLKQISLTLFLFAAIITVAVQTSCEKNSCNGVTCYNGGSCGHGLCRCPTAFEGAECQTKVTDRYIGKYGGYSSCNNGAYTIDSAFITIPSPARGMLEVDVRLKSLAPNILRGYVSSNASTYSIIVTNNDSAKANTLFYRRIFTITLQSDKNLSIHTYEQYNPNADDTVYNNRCLFLGYKSI